ncbi:type III pantothenate kinase [Bifidobacterium bohemicum]|uniref:Type III pantothenate kinase n=1 Tax=Bifidobacterium bohemicum DSM 22767 TaxID=1437606 RepID=A0A086ZK47_9BIFI|nr:type III pantothenate kinase [Bifidobacterium bohemicum]KFI46897.1 pantothenate kinase [Bifidobacterium bohemicum DSM 22767]SCB84354.1 type III pantothenate kinase [Bifidobacterium bohemicum]
MLVAVDIGNTNIVIGFLDGRQITGTFRVTTAARHTSDEYGLMLMQFLAVKGLKAQDVDDVIIASVVPQVMHSFRASIVKFLGLEPMVVGPGVKSGLSIRLDDPKSLGADCLADCVGAYGVYGGPVLVADFGTATTFNYVNEHKAIMSGLISPGLQTAANSLVSGTAQLPEVEITRPDSILATGTKTAMQAGLYYNFLGGIERTIRQFHEEIDEPFQVIATGGLGSVFMDDTDMIDVYDPDLIFKGMELIYQLNS